MIASSEGSPDMAGVTFSFLFLSFFHEERDNDASANHGFSDQQRVGSLNQGMLLMPDGRRLGINRVPSLRPVGET
jgi:hypothetical protein